MATGVRMRADSPAIPWSGSLPGAGVEGAPAVRAIVFDLYGTLLRISRPRVNREIPRLLGVDRRRWVALLRGSLLRHPFVDARDMAGFLCRELAPGCGPEVETACRELIESEVDSVVADEAAEPLLAFLSRRGFALGALSNLSSPHREPLDRLGLGRHFAAAVFSCDEGSLKPDPRLYREVCRRLAVEPGAAIMVGDSLANDVLAPQAAGLRGLRLGAPSGELPAVSSLGELAWWSLAPGRPLERLLGEGDRILLGGEPRRLQGLRLLPAGEQGRYNLVAAARAVAPAGEDVEVFCKRFLFPAAAHVEELAHRVHREIGLPACDTWIARGSEPCLVVSRAPGAKLQAAEVAADPRLAEDAGRHGAAGWLFANADLRPRNACSTSQGRITLFDLEHCFFNLALDVTGIGDPFRPQSFDRLSPAALAARLRKRALTPQTARRARRAFLPDDDPRSEACRAFRHGWVETYRAVQRNSGRLLAMLAERLATEPYLIIGTAAHRRAMAQCDLDDIAARLAADPEEVLDRSF